jgi:hypothetical protein
MPRIAVVALIGALSASAAAAQQAPAAAPAPAPARVPATAPATQAAAPEQPGQVNAVDWIRGALANEQYDPQDRARARNYAPEIEAGTHWRSSIFDGRRSRATSGTGLRLPNLPSGDAE